MLNFKNISYAIIPIIITLTVNAQIVPINPEIKKALEASGISLDEFQSMMESQMVKILLLTKPRALKTLRLIRKKYDVSLRLRLKNL